MHPVSKGAPGSYGGVSSNQVGPRHIGRSAYRCYLPVLTGFTGSYCAGPGPQHHLPSSIARKRHSLKREFGPAIAGCGYRAPLPPRLARSPNSGGDERIRTADPLVANEVLSQLSYIPTVMLFRTADMRCRIFYSGGERGIRTPGAVTCSTVFETAPFNQLWHLSALFSSPSYRSGRLTYAHRKIPRIPPRIQSRVSGGERGIRTLGGVMPHTRFPIVPIQPALASLRLVSLDRTCAKNSWRRSRLSSSSTRPRTSMA